MLARSRARLTAKWAATAASGAVRPSAGLYALGVRCTMLDARCTTFSVRCSARDPCRFGIGLGADCRPKAAQRRASNAAAAAAADRSQPASEKQKSAPAERRTIISADYGLGSVVCIRLASFRPYRRSQAARSVRRNGRIANWDAKSPSEPDAAAILRRPPALLRPPSALPVSGRVWAGRAPTPLPVEVQSSAAAQRWTAKYNGAQ